MYILTSELTKTKTKTKIKPKTLLIPNIANFIKLSDLFYRYCSDLSFITPNVKFVKRMMAGLRGQNLTEEKVRTI